MVDCKPGSGVTWRGAVNLARLSIFSANSSARLANSPPSAFVIRGLPVLERLSGTWTGLRRSMACHTWTVVLWRH
jgi:hypothetical protein